MGKGKQNRGKPQAGSNGEAALPWFVQLAGQGSDGFELSDWHDFAVAAVSAGVGTARAAELADGMMAEQLGRRAVLSQGLPELDDVELPPEADPESAPEGAAVQTSDGP